MARGRREEAHTMFDRTTLGIGSSEIEPADASK